jgi:hypothetical protein
METPEPTWIEKITSLCFSTTRSQYNQRFWLWALNRMKMKSGDQSPYLLIRSQRCNRLRHRLEPKINRECTCTRIFLWNPQSHYRPDVTGHFFDWPRPAQDDLLQQCSQYKGNLLTDLPPFLTRQSHERSSLLRVVAYSSTCIYLYFSTVKLAPHYMDIKHATWHPRLIQSASGLYPVHNTWMACWQLDFEITSHPWHSAV